jgi:hypothetical protein
MVMFHELTIKREFSASMSWQAFFKLSSSALRALFSVVSSATFLPNSSHSCWEGKHDKCKLLYITISVSFGNTRLSSHYKVTSKATSTISVTKSIIPCLSQIWAPLPIYCHVVSQNKQLLKARHLTLCDYGYINKFLGSPWPYNMIENSAWMEKFTRVSYYSSSGGNE